MKRTLLVVGLYPFHVKPCNAVQAGPLGAPTPRRAAAEMDVFPEYWMSQAREDIPPTVEPTTVGVPRRADSVPARPAAAFHVKLAMATRLPLLGARSRSRCPCASLRTGSEHVENDSAARRQRTPIGLVSSSRDRSDFGFHGHHVGNPRLTG